MNREHLVLFSIALVISSCYDFTLSPSDARVEGGPAEDEGSITTAGKNGSLGTPREDAVIGTQSDEVEVEDSGGDTENGTVTQREEEDENETQSDEAGVGDSEVQNPESDATTGNSTSGGPDDADAENDCSCDTDGLECTHDICRSGECFYEIKSGFCLIDGICYADKEQSPKRECQYCDAANSQEEWRNKPYGTSCDDGKWCNGPDGCDMTGNCFLHTEGAPCVTEDTCKRCEEASRSCVNDTTKTWYDSTTDLSWQAALAGDSTSRTRSWQESLDHCADIVFCGHNDWRLPTISELRSLISGCSTTRIGGRCGVIDTCRDDSSSSTCYDEASCSGCTEKSGVGSECYWPSAIQLDCLSFSFWSSTSSVGGSDGAWVVTFSEAGIETHAKSNTNREICVRAGAEGSP